jgi:hypothetical protein
MNFVKDFSQFVGEASDAHNKLVQLGLATRNQKLIADVEEIIELCPNLSYVTYPDSTFLNASKQVAMPNPEIEKAHVIMRRLEDDEKMTPELRKKLRDLGDRYQFKQRLSLLVDIAKKEYGEEFLNQIDNSFRDTITDNFSKMIQDLKQIDEGGEADLYVWDINGWDLPYTYFNSAKEGDRFNTGKVLEILKENPENCKKVSHLSITNKMDSDFAKRMSSGEFGPLD